MSLSKLSPLAEKVATRASKLAQWESVMISERRNVVATVLRQARSAFGPGGTGVRLVVDMVEREVYVGHDAKAIHAHILMAQMGVPREFATDVLFNIRNPDPPYEKVSGKRLRRIVALVVEPRGKVLAIRPGDIHVGLAPALVKKAARLAGFDVGAPFKATSFGMTFTYFPTSISAPKGAVTQEMTEGNEQTVRAIRSMMIRADNRVARLVVDLRGKEVAIGSASDIHPDIMLKKFRKHVLGKGRANVLDAHRLMQTSDRFVGLNVGPDPTGHFIQVTISDAQYLTAPASVLVAAAKIAGFTGKLKGRDLITAHPAPMAPSTNPTAQFREMIEAVAQGQDPGQVIDEAYDPNASLAFPGAWIRASGKVEKLGKGMRHQDIVSAPLGETLRKGLIRIREFSNVMGVSLHKSDFANKRSKAWKSLLDYAVDRSNKLTKVVIDIWSGSDISDRVNMSMDAFLENYA